MKSNTNNRNKAREALKECNSMLDNTQCKILEFIKDYEVKSNLELSDKVNDEHD